MFDGDPYKILGVSPRASKERICRIFRQRSLRLGSKGADIGNDPVFQRLKSAYELLSNPERRREFDLSRDDKKQPSDQAKQWAPLMKALLEDEAESEPPLPCIVKKTFWGKLRVHYICPQCKNELNSPLEDAGREVNCPFCRVEFVTPGESELFQHKNKQEEDRRRDIEATERAKDIVASSPTGSPAPAQPDSSEQHPARESPNMYEVEAPPLEKFVGQSKLIKILLKAVRAAKINHTAVPHAVFAGRPGMGKDLLVASLADARGVKVIKIMGSQLREEMINEAALSADASGHDKNGFVTNREIVHPSILWIDECEMVNTGTWELLRPILQPGPDGRRIVSTKLERSIKRYQIWFPEITMILTTTNLGKLRRRAGALLDRIPLILTLEPYSIDELKRIIIDYAVKSETAIEHAAAVRIAERSRGTPRTAKMLLDRCRSDLTTTLNRPLRQSDRISVAMVEETVSGIAETGGVDDEICEGDGRNARRSISDETKVFVWRRDAGKCAKCGSNENLEYDHIIPWSQGGSNTARNLQLLCEACNRSKGGNLV